MRILILLLALLTAPTAQAQQIIGSHSLGCIAGAAALPAEGPGWQAIRLSRNRFYGHPALITAIATLAARARSAGMGDLWIGDLGLPQGGPMPSGHASHQIGLDADIWLDLRPKPLLPPVRREAIDVPSVVLPGGASIDPARWTPQHEALIRMAAELPGIDRVLVNPAIKRELCRTSAGQPWLRRIRPWWGHDEHIHIRLPCPAGQPDCRNQAPPPAGDGCDATLAWWFSPEARLPVRRPPGPAPVLPAACRAILAR